MKKFIVFAVVLCFSVAAYAQNYMETRKADLSVHLGAYWPFGEIDTGGNGTYGYEVGGVFGVEGQYFFTENIGVGVNLDYAFYNAEALRITGFGNINTDITTLYFGPEVVVRYPQPNFDVFASLGFGYIKNKVEYSGASSGDEDDSTFGLLLQAGGRYYLTRNVNVGAKLRYLYNNQDIDDKIGNEDSLDLSAISFLVSLGYSF